MDLEHYVEITDTDNDLDLSLNHTEHFIEDYRQFIIAKLAQKALLLKDLDTFLQNTPELIYKVLSTDIILIFEYNEHKKCLKLLAGHGQNNEVPNNICLEIKSGECFNYLLHNKYKPVITENFETDTRFGKPSIFSQYNIKSGIGIAIHGQGQSGPYGIIYFLFKSERILPKSDIKFIQSISFIVASAISQYETLTKLREEEEQSRILMEYASDAMIVFDSTGTIYAVNSKACDLTDFSKQELLTKKVKDLYVPDEINDYYVNLKVLLETQNVIFERKLLRRDGSFINAEVNAKVLPNGLLQGIYRDITSRKANEELLRNAQKMEAIGRVSGGIAHDFNNYLSIISGYIEKLLDTANDDLEIASLKKDLLHVKKTADKASFLVRELLTFSHKKNIESELISVNDLLQEMQHSIKSFLGEKAILCYDLEKDIHTIKINPNLLWQSILNLIINAKDSLDLKGSKIPTLTIKTFNYYLEKTYNGHSFNAEPGNYVAISVNDNGIGLTKTAKSHLFEPFFTTKSPKNGTGLGLSSIYGFVKSFDGFVRVESTENEFANFTIFLKKAQVANMQKTTKKLITTDETTNKITNILLVEDNDDLRELLTEILIKKQYNALSASNGIEALEKINAGLINYDLIITDIIMPEMDGVEFIKSLHAMKYSAKIIAMSGYTVKDPTTLPLKVKFIPKPFSINSLISTINNL